MTEVPCLGLKSPYPACTGPGMAKLVLCGSDGGRDLVLCETGDFLKSRATLGPGALGWHPPPCLQGMPYQRGDFTQSDEGNGFRF